MQTPVAHVVDRWPTGVAAVDPLRHAGQRRDGRRAAVAAASATVALPSAKAAGAVNVAAAARPWEKLGPPVRVTLVPEERPSPVVLAAPAPGAQLDPLTPLRLTFSQSVASSLGNDHPRLSLRQQGRWVQTDSHTLVFRPSGDGAPFDSDETPPLPQAGARARRDDVARRAARRSSGCSNCSRSEGYLPRHLVARGGDVALTKRAELAAATAPPAGTFSWRYPNTPPELVALWNPGEPDTVTRGAVMMFQHDHGLTVDGIVGPQVWHAAIADAVAGKLKLGGYSYVYVHRNVPQLLTLWHSGHVVLTSPGNTGVPAAPTALGTWPVFEHIPVGRMSGRNPDGTHYDDPGIRWISYFHGGEALHAFNRASFGTPQSLGCVELPLDQAAKVWPYTPIGTLVTIED